VAVAGSNPVYLTERIIMADKTTWPQCTSVGCYQKFAPDGGTSCYNCRKENEFEAGLTETQIPDKILASVFGDDNPDPSKPKNMGGEPDG
jgi:hypothetical protein